MASQLSGLLSPFLFRRRAAAAAPFLTGRVLDFGCGPGHLSRWSSPQLYVGVDRDADSLALAKQQYPRYQFVAELPDSGVFDTIVALAVLEHLADPARLLRQLGERLTAGGRIVITTPHPWADQIHRWGAKLGLFSSEAEAEHETLLDRVALERVGQAAGLALETYRRFLLGLNQLAVLRKK